MEQLKEEPLKRIDFQKGTFQANGKNYIIEGSLTIERYAELQILEKEMAYGLSVKGMYEKLQKLYTDVNKMKFADVAVAINDLMRGVAKLQEREPVVLKICALFINVEDEDRKEFSTDMINRKIADWKQEGIDMRDFFMVASNSVNGFLEIYKTVARIISAPENRPAPGLLE
jgi:hypothetical protein